MLVALGHAAVEAGHRVRYFTATELVETLYRGLGHNSVGRVIDTVLRNDVVLLDELGFAPSTTPEPNYYSGSSPLPTNADPSASHAFPSSHRLRIWSTNPIKRIDREIKRRDRVAGMSQR
jgi:hypothetical protein